MELRHLRYFVAVAEELHFGRAADRLHIVQPALSRQVAALEREMDVKLFDRSGGRIALTAAGESFLEEATTILTQVDRAVTSSKAISRGEFGSLEIGFVGPAMWSVLPTILKQYRSRFPGVRFHVHEMPIATQMARLRDGSINVGFLRPSGSYDETIATETIWKESFIVGLPDDHPMADADEVDLAQLADEPFIMIPRSDSPPFHDQFIELCHEYGFTPTVVEEARSMAALHLVAAGIGVTILTDSVASRAWPGIRFRRLTRPGREVELALAYRRGNTSLTVASFVETVRSVVPDIPSLATAELGPVRPVAKRMTRHVKAPVQAAAVVSARSNLSKYSEPVRHLDIEPLAKPAPVGKRMTIISCPTTEMITRGATTAGETIGWDVTVTTPQFTAESTVSAWSSALESEPDVIVAMAPFPLTSVSQQLDEAKKAGIIVVTVGAEPTPVGGESAVAADANGAGVFGSIARLYADVAIADAGKGPNAALVVDPAVPAWAAIRSEFKKRITAAGGKAGQIDVPLTEIGTGGPGRVLSYIEKNPDTEYVVTTIPEFYVGMRQALQSAGLDDTVKVIVGAARRPTVEQVKSGELIGAVAIEEIANGWRLVDAAARKMTGTSMSWCTHIKPSFLIVTPNANIDAGEELDTYPYIADDFIAAWKGSQAGIRA